MNRNELKKLALVGIAAGIAATSQGQGADIKEQDLAKRSEGNLGYYLMSEEDLMLELSPNGWKLYQGMDPEGKRLALLVASQRCQNTNPCKGLNACKTGNNECAGKGACKGLGKCGFADKNLAVKVVADRMSKKRKELIK